MASYQDFFAAVHQTTTAHSSGPVSQAVRRELTRQAAQYWNENKEDIKAMTKREVANLAEEIVEV